MVAVTRHIRFAFLAAAVTCAQGGDWYIEAMYSDSACTTLKQKDVSVTGQCISYSGVGGSGNKKLSCSSAKSTYTFYSDSECSTLGPALVHMGGTGSVDIDPTECKEMTLDTWLKITCNPTIQTFSCKKYENFDCTGAAENLPDTEYEFCKVFSDKVEKTVIQDGAWYDQEFAVGSQSCSGTVIGSTKKGTFGECFVFSTNGIICTAPGTEPETETEPEPETEEAPTKYSGSHGIRMSWMMFAMSLCLSLGLIS